jgi:hypothetical protein
VRDEPPQKWRNRRVGLSELGEPEDVTWRLVLESRRYVRECCMLRSLYFNERRKFAQELFQNIAISFLVEKQAATWMYI